jgi:hypothetical protein
MIRFHFTLKNPFPIAYKDRDFDQVDYLCHNWSLTKNKAFEIQITKWARATIFSIGLDACWIVRIMAVSGLTLNCSDGF